MVNDPQQIILFRNVRDTIVWYLSHPFFRRNVCAARRIFTPWGKSHENKRFILVTSSPNSAGRVLASRDEEVFSLCTNLSFRSLRMYGQLPLLTLALLELRFEAYHEWQQYS